MKLETQVSYFMKTKKIVVNPEDNLLKTDHYFKFTDENFLVVEDNQKFIGILCKSDLKYYKNSFKINEGQAESNRLFLKNHKVKEVFTNRLAFLNPIDQMTDVVLLFKTLLAEVMPVVRNGKILGLVTKHEIEKYTKLVIDNSQNSGLLL